MKKRGQLTIFIIIAILIVAIIALFFAFRGKLGVGKEERIPSDVAPIKNFVEECVDETAGKVVYEIGQRGGYLSPENVFELDEKEYAYYLIDGKNYMPSKAQVEKEISDYFDIRIFVCTNYFVDFPGYEVEQGNSESSAKILEDKVLFDIKYPLAIKKGNATSRLEEFEAEVPIRLNIIYDSVAGFISEQEKNKEALCISCFSNLTEESLSVDISGEAGGTIFRLIDNNSIINNKPFEWVFANKYG